MIHSMKKPREGAGKIFEFGLDFGNNLWYDIFRFQYAPVAQLDRASDYGSEGREFESSPARHVGAKYALLRLIFLPLAEK